MLSNYKFWGNWVGTLTGVYLGTLVDGHYLFYLFIWGFTSLSGQRKPVHIVR